MIRRFVKRITVNFRQTRSERVATNSYRNYHQKIRRLFNKALYQTVRGKENILARLRKQRYKNEL